MVWISSVLNFFQNFHFFNVFFQQMVELATEFYALYIAQRNYV